MTNVDRFNMFNMTGFFKKNTPNIQNRKQVPCGGLVIAKCLVGAAGQ